ncbi:hypothetical protein [Streptomyces sp. NPDC002172]
MEQQPGGHVVDLAFLESHDVLAAEGDPGDARVQTYTYDSQDHLTSTVEEGRVLSPRFFDGAGMFLGTRLCS